MEHKVTIYIYNQIQLWEKKYFSNFVPKNPTHQYNLAYQFTKVRLLGMYIFFCNFC